MTFTVPNAFSPDTKIKSGEVNENFDAVETAINELLVTAIPTGIILPAARNEAPDGYLLCQGQAVSRSKYADLFGVVGVTYGAGDGGTTFNVPDLRGRVPVGVDGTAGRLSANDTLGKSGGSEKLRTHKHSMEFNTGGEFPPHNHDIPFFASTRHEGTGFAYQGVSAGGNTLTGVENSDHIHLVKGNTAPAGSGTEDGIQMPPFQIVSYLIKT
jgi:microcystin-dependent protein